MKIEVDGEILSHIPLSAIIDFQCVNKENITREKHSIITIVKTHSLYCYHNINTKMIIVIS